MPRIVFACWLGVGVVTAALAMLVLILLMRQWAERKDRIHQRAAVFWGKILIHASRGAPVELPVLARRDLSGFIDAWNYLRIDL